MRLAEWPRDPYLNDELREWVSLHLSTLGVSDVAIFAVTTGREEDERRILVATEVGLLDGWYAPRGSTARYGLGIRLYPWQQVHGVDLRAETLRLWAHEHESTWRLRIANPAFDAVATTPDLGQAIAQFAAACSVMAEPAGEVPPGSAEAPPASAGATQAPAAAATQPPAAGSTPSAAERLRALLPDLDEDAGPDGQHGIPIQPEVEADAEPPLDLERRLGLRPRD